MNEFEAHESSYDHQHKKVSGRLVIPFALHFKTVSAMHQWYLESVQDIRAAVSAMFFAGSI